MEGRGIERVCMCVCVCVCMCVCGWRGVERGDQG